MPVLPSGVCMHPSCILIKPNDQQKKKGCIESMHGVRVQADSQETVVENTRRDLACIIGSLEAYERLRKCFGDKSTQCKVVWAFPPLYRKTLAFVTVPLNMLKLDVLFNP